MYLLDTGVLSQTAKTQPNERVMAWWAGRRDSDLALSAVSIHELRYGIELLPTGARRVLLESWFGKVLDRFRGRVHAVEEVIASLSGAMLAETKIAGHTAEVSDVLIAATARVHGLKLATLNRKHFEGFGVELLEF